MKLGIGSDHMGFEFKEAIKAYVENTTEHVVIDYGCDACSTVDYPDVAFEVSKGIHEGELDRAILICGTGIGVSIAANKYPGIRAALAHDTYSAERAQLSNNAQIITMGAQIIGVEVGKKVVNAYLNSEWAEGSKRKVDKIIEKEKLFIKDNTEQPVSSHHQCG